MAKPATYPTLFDECKTVSISFLKINGYLKPDQWKIGTITWSRGEGEHKRITGSISVEVNTDTKSPFIELQYKKNDKPVKYRVQLVSIPSNIGKGVVWYFLCPNTGNRCRKLYLADTYFLHRLAVRGCMYEKQTYSHKNKMLYRSWDKLFCIDKVYEQIYGKHFKKQYAGKPTKRYIKLWKQIQAARNINKRQLLNW
ncbi:MAG: hypothetical protein ABJB05_07645 [Parafilimonas sp.]